MIKKESQNSSDRLDACSIQTELWPGGVKRTRIQERKWANGDEHTQVHEIEKDR